MDGWFVRNRRPLGTLSPAAFRAVGSMIFAATAAIVVASQARRTLRNSPPENTVAERPTTETPNAIARLACLLPAVAPAGSYSG
jgi:hypothetical protein